MLVVRTIGQAFEVCHHLNQSKQDDSVGSEENNLPEHKDVNTTFIKSIPTKSEAFPMRTAQLFGTGDLNGSDDPNREKSIETTNVNHTVFLL
jgi:hypothetical protein